MSVYVFLQSTTSYDHTLEVHRKDTHCHQGCQFRRSPELFEIPKEFSTTVVHSRCTQQHGLIEIPLVDNKSKSDRKRPHSQSSQLKALNFARYHCIGTFDTKMLLEEHKIMK